MTDSLSQNPTEVLDVAVIGAGFSGLCVLHQVREMGLSTCILERADVLGGTWAFNRYPGARCDIESIEYSYSFSPVIEAEWTWSDLLPAQDEIEEYLNFVADRLDLRHHIRFGTDVSSMTFDEVEGHWHLHTADGTRISARFVVAATGILSAPVRPDIEGIDTFRGDVLFSSSFPQEGYDFADKRVALIGTGSTGVQATPVVAAVAEHLHVFQRSAAYTMPSGARPYGPGEFEDLRSRYPEIREAQRRSFIGAARVSAFSALTEVADKPPILGSTRDERLRAIDENGVRGALLWSDVLFDMDASKAATELYAEAVARVVEDPETAAALVPDYPFGCKRPIIDAGYYESFNRDNVTLVDLHKGGIRAITPSGIDTDQGSFDFDTILFATGFDAITGALSRMDIRGVGGVSLRERWEVDGPVSYLGIGVAGFPNLFTIQGPGSPSATTNFVAALEQHVEWIVRCLADLRERDLNRIEATEDAQAAWVDQNNAMVEGSLVLDPSCNSWYNGGNVPGKRRMFLAFPAGLPEYRRLCDEIADSDYNGFVLS